MDLAKISGGSGILSYRGMTIESKSGIDIQPSLETFDVPIDGIAEAADQRTTRHAVTITVTPTGKWSNPERLFPYLALPPGRFVLPILPVSINTSTDVLTSAGHGFVAGDAVLVGIRAGGTLPTSTPQVDEDTTYYVSAPTADTLKLHTTRADALAGTNAIDLSAAGTDVVLVGQFDLVLNMVDGTQMTFHAVAISKQPDLNLTRSETPFGQVEFQAFVRSRKRTDAASSIYTIASVAFPGWSAEASDIKTQSPKVAWADLLKFGTSDVNTSTDVITITGHGLTTADKVYLDSLGTLPAASPALDPDRAYYVRVLTSSTIQLHLTSSDASGNTNKIDLTNTGSGTHLVFKDNPPYTLMDTEAGVKISAPASLEDVTVDRDGVVNAQLKSAGLEASLIPLGPSAQNVLDALKLQGSGAVLGRSLAAGSKPLHIFSTGMYVQLSAAALKEAPLAANMKDRRVRELKFVGTRRVVGGTLAAVGQVGTAPS